MDIDDDGVTDPTTEFGDLFEGQTVAFENELDGHDADDVLGAISHDLGITTSSHQRSSHHPSDHDILSGNLNFVPDDYLHGQQMVMNHENSEYNMSLPEVGGADGHPNLQNHQMPQDPTQSGHQQIYLHTIQPMNQQVNSEVSATNQMTYEYNYNQIAAEIAQSSCNNVPVAAPPLPDEPKAKTKIKVVKDVEYFTNENMERYMKRRGFKSKRGEIESRKSISKAVFALSADSQISSEHFRLVSFGSRYEPEYVVQELERFWKFYLATKARNLALSSEFLPMLIPMLLHFYFEMVLSRMFPVARRICVEFSKKFLHEDKTQEHYDVLVAVMKVNSLEQLKTDSILGPLINRKCEFVLSDLALSHLRNFLSKSTQPILINLFTSRFKISTRESKELIQSYDWDNLDSEEEGEETSSSEEDDDHHEISTSRKYVTRVIEDLRNSPTANLPAISVYTTGDDPVCGSISKKGSLIAYGLTEAGIRLCTVENARDVSKITYPTQRPTDPESFYGIKSIGGHAGTVYGVHFHPRAKMLFSVGQDSFMRAWDLNSDCPRCRVVYRGHSGPIWKLDIPESGSLLATAGLDSTARIFVPEKTEFVRIMVGHYCSVNTVKFHPNEAYIATGSADKSVRLWSVNDGSIVRMFTGSAGSVNCVAFHESGKYLAGAGEDAKIVIWDLAQGEILASLDCLPNCRDLEFNGSTLSACFRNGMLQIFNLRRIFGGSSHHTNDDIFQHQRPPSICEPFTTQCFAKTLFKVHYMNSGRLVCLGSDMSMDADELKAREAAKASVDAELAKCNPPETQKAKPSETILQQVLQTVNTPPAAKPSKPTTTASQPKKQSSGIVTVIGSNGSSRILAARLSQPAPTPSTTTPGDFSGAGLGSEPVVAVNEGSMPTDTTGVTSETVTDTPSESATPTTNQTQQMITSAELDAAIASVIDQSGGDNSESGGTITMYASS